MANLRFRFAAAKERPVESRQESKEYGDLGEQIASRYLEDQGDVILGRNYRNGHKEVDIIALDRDELAVVEVKTRTREDHMAAEQAVDHRKRQNIIRAANSFIRRNHRTEPVRFDIIAIIGAGPDAQIRHTKNAFSAMSF